MIGKHSKERPRTTISAWYSYDAGSGLFSGAAGIRTVASSRLLCAYTGRQASLPDDASIACTAGRLSPFDWACLGRRRIAGRAIRFDALDRLARMAHLRASQGAFIATQEMFEAVGLEGTPFEQLMGALGYAAQQSEDGTTFRRKSRKRQKKGQRRRMTLTPDPNSPFALLRDLANAK